MKQNCKIIADLLPLYADGVCSPSSRQAVEAHLESCESCANALKRLQNPEFSELPDRSEEAIAKKAAKALKKGKHRSFRKGCILTAALVLALIFLVLHILVPKPINPTALKAEDNFRFRNIPWDTSILMTRLLWGHKMEENPGKLILEPNERVLVSRNSCTYNGQTGNVHFYFKDGKLYHIGFQFQRIKDTEWSADLLTLLQDTYGPETISSPVQNSPVQYQWREEETILVFVGGGGNVSFDIAVLSLL